MGHLILKLKSKTFLEVVNKNTHWLRYSSQVFCYCEMFEMKTGRLGRSKSSSYATIFIGWSGKIWGRLKKQTTSTVETNKNSIKRCQKKTLFVRNKQTKIDRAQSKRNQIFVSTVKTYFDCVSVTEHRVVCRSRNFFFVFYHEKPEILCKLNCIFPRFNVFF